MRKQIAIGAISAGVLLLGVIGNSSNPQSSNLGTSQEVESAQTNTLIETAPVAKPICDGLDVVSDCTVDGTNYKTYIYHPAAAEKSHTEQVTTYEQKISGYCTLCNDGTYSPSCATGRGGHALTMEA